MWGVKLQIIHSSFLTRESPWDIRLYSSDWCMRGVEILKMLNQFKFWLLSFCWACGCIRWFTSVNYSEWLMACISPLILWFTSFCLAASNPASLPPITANANTVSGIQQQSNHIKSLYNYNPKRLDVMEGWGNMICTYGECILYLSKLFI